MRQEEVWALQIVYMFLNKYEYRLINVGNQPIKSELWLANPNGQYPVIRVTTKSIATNFFDNERLVQTKDAVMGLVNTKGKMLSIHISDELSDKNEKDIVEVCLTKDYLSDDSILETYPLLTNTIKATDDPQADYDAITKAINIIQMKGYSKSKSWVVGDRTTIYIIMAVCIGIFFLSNMLYQLSTSKTVIAVALGALYKTFVYGNFEFWRLFTAGFLHVDLMHLLVNMYSFYHLGPSIEKIYGRKHFIISLFGAIIIGSAFALIGSFNSITVGISGGLFGLLGMLFVYAFETNSIRDKRVMGSFIQIFIINTLIIAVVPNISWLGHAGGFIAGIMFGLIFSKKSTWNQLRKNSVMALIILFIALINLTFVDQRKLPIDPALDHQVVELYKKLNLNWYADMLDKNIADYYQTVR
ncbi:MAG: rhomboid family intramembrane serine protease [Erysipelotrichaceae bacterium]|nr:rhomboid family intramembrane serine protease [Erysipelotrichaceae bacterium]